MRHAHVTFALIVGLVWLWGFHPASAQPLKVAVISQSANNWPLFVAEE